MYLLLLLLLLFLLLPPNKLFKGRHTTAVPALEELFKLKVAKWLCRRIMTKCFLGLLGAEKLLIISRCLSVKTIKGRGWSQLVLPQKLLN
jgi:hypothetical protein